MMANCCWSSTVVTLPVRERPPSPRPGWNCSTMTARRGRRSLIAGQKPPGPRGGGRRAPPFPAAPANYTGLVNVEEGSAGGASVAVAFRDLAAASDDPGTFTNDSEQWAASVIAIRPAAGATYSGSFTGDAYIQKLGIGGSLTADAYIRKTDIAGSFTADAYLLKTDISGSFTADAYVLKVDIGGSFTADAYI